MALDKYYLQIKMNCRLAIVRFGRNQTNISFELVKHKSQMTMLRWITSKFVIQTISNDSKLK